MQSKNRAICCQNTAVISRRVRLELTTFDFNGLEYCFILNRSLPILFQGGFYSVSYMMSACENEIIANTPHDDIEFTGSGMLMKNIVAVYAVKTNTSGDDFIIVDDKNQKEFQRVLDEVYSFRYYTTEREETIMRQYVDADGNPYYVEETIIKTVLYIERNTMTASEAADHFSFNARQREYLDTLMSRNFDDMWAVLLH